MNIEDVKVGMKVVLTENYYNLKVGDILTVESIDRHGDIWAPGIFCTNPSRVRPATPEDVAPQLWQSYKDALNDEALAALEQVIMGEHPEDLDFKDCSCLSAAFTWHETLQGGQFWDDVYGGEYNKQGVPEVTKFDFTNTKINIKKYAEENGITLEQALKDVEVLTTCKVNAPNINYVYILQETEAGAVFSRKDSEGFFNAQSFKEITLTRNVTITPAFVTTETVSLPDGRTVLKKDYDEALSKLKTFTGN